jgi:hypothetical protein
VEDRGQRLFALDFDLAIGPARDLYDAVDDVGVVLIRVKRDLGLSSARAILESGL